MHTASLLKQGAIKLPTAFLKTSALISEKPHISFDNRRTIVLSRKLFIFRLYIYFCSRYSSAYIFTILKNNLGAGHSWNHYILHWSFRFYALRCYTPFKYIVISVLGQKQNPSTDIGQ
nr:MAG TPA: hypothetical protein [Bacteriophage sp.]